MEVYQKKISQTEYSARIFVLSLKLTKPTAYFFWGGGLVTAQGLWFFGKNTQKNVYFPVVSSIRSFSPFFAPWCVVSGVFGLHQRTQADPSSSVVQHLHVPAGKTSGRINKNWGRVFYSLVDA